VSTAQEYARQFEAAKQIEHIGEHECTLDHLRHEANGAAVEQVTHPVYGCNVWIFEDGSALLEHAGDDSRLENMYQPFATALEVPGLGGRNY